MSTIVTIGIPVYKRLHYLRHALESVAVQDYPSIELLVSDNGMNGIKVKDIVDQWYPRAYRFRQNPMTVKIASHYNQLIHEASGHYFVCLADDDTISPNFISVLVSILERHPDVALAMGRQETMDASGRLLGTSSEQVPDRLSGADFVRAWTRYGFANYTTVLARTMDLRHTGGYPDFTRGIHSDDASVLKLCLGRSVAFSKRCTFRLRREESTMSASLSYQELAQATRSFLIFLDSDPTILAYASSEPILWAELKECMVTMTWWTYLNRWQIQYRQRLPPLQWVRAAFVVPFIPDYYRRVRSSLLCASKVALVARAKKLMPRAYKFYRALKSSRT